MFRYLPEAGGLVFRGFLLSLSRRSQEALTKALEYFNSAYLPRVIKFAGASKMLFDKLRTTEKGQKEVWRMEETKRGSLKWGLKVLAHASCLGRRCLCLCKPPLIRLRLYGRMSEVFGQMSLLPPVICLRQAFQPQISFPRFFSSERWLPAQRLWQMQTLLCGT